AFTKTISEGDARMLIDHDSYYVVSRVSADTLGLAEDDRGLAVDSALDAGLSYVGDLKANVRNGNITGMSFGFQVIKDDWQLIDIEVNSGGTTETVQAELRILREVRLFEVSAVTFPAYEDTEASLRAVATALRHRGDSAAIEQRAQYRPELLGLLQTIDREPGESTRGTDEDTEPAAATRLSRTSVNRRMQALAARYGLAR
ncbi:HK97 family phage prohead protease, partial [Micromonospora sp. NPDC002575]|uniref:HK97 family phage prohead protease n=1 Tax=Micromonospora sp. NPDC002575 TaxID=3364222 RepID=UPI0036A805E3